MLTFARFHNCIITAIELYSFIIDIIMLINPSSDYGNPIAYKFQCSKVIKVNLRGMLTIMR